MKHTVNADGSMRREILRNDNPGHANPTSAHLPRSAAQWTGKLAGAIVDTVAATYRKGVQERVITPSGWTGHDLGKLRFANSHGERVAETASAGDAAQLALWLALRAGHTDLLDDVVTAWRESACCRRRSRRAPETARRVGRPRAPYARGGCILDVAAAVLHTLTDIHANTVDRTDQGVIVNLHLNCTNEHVSVSCCSARDSVLTVRPRVQDHLLIRVPDWTDRRTLRLTINVRQKSAKASSVPTCTFPRNRRMPGLEVVVRYDLPLRETAEKTDAGGRVFRFLWQGDEIVGMEPPGKDRTPYIHP